MNSKLLQHSQGMAQIKFKMNTNIKKYGVRKMSSSRVSRHKGHKYQYQDPKFRTVMYSYEHSFRPVQRASRDGRPPSGIANIIRELLKLRPALKYQAQG